MVGHAGTHVSTFKHPDEVPAIHHLVLHDAASPLMALQVLKNHFRKLRRVKLKRSSAVCAPSEAEMRRMVIFQILRAFSAILV